MRKAKADAVSVKLAIRAKLSSWVIFHTASALNSVMHPHASASTHHVLTFYHSRVTLCVFLPILDLAFDQEDKKKALILWLIPHPQTNTPAVSGINNTNIERRGRGLHEDLFQVVMADV